MPTQTDTEFGAREAARAVADVLGYHASSNSYEWLANTSQRAALHTIPPQDVITRDNVPARVDAVAYFRVVDADASVIDLENPRPCRRPRVSSDSAAAMRPGCRTVRQPPPRAAPRPGTVLLPLPLDIIGSVVRGAGDNGRENRRPAAQARLTAPPDGDHA